jgi:hypothetical protein
MVEPEGELIGAVYGALTPKPRFTEQVVQLDADRRPSGPLGVISPPQLSGPAPNVAKKTLVKC